MKRHKYMLTPVLSLLDTVFKTQKPFVFYRKPHDSTIYTLISKDQKLQFLDDFNQKGFVFAPFDDRKKTIIFPLNNVETKAFSYSNNTFSNDTDTTLNHTDKAQHLLLLEQGISYIKTQKTPKIVLSRKEVLQKKCDIIQTFKNLLDKYPTAMVYVWFHPKVGLWLGATPETLLTSKNNNFKTMALAGTQVYKDTKIVWENKEIQEHQFVTDYITQALSTLNIPFTVSKTSTLKAGSLVHLHASITGRLKHENQIGELIHALHPTPAVCGLPKEKSKQFILKHENYNREFYTGFLGELNFKTDRRQTSRNKRNIENQAYHFKDTQSALFVNLRCMQIKNNTIYIYVGGGITKDSNPQKEYLETVAKSKIMTSILCFEKS